MRNKYRLLEALILRGREGIRTDAEPALKQKVYELRKTYEIDTVKRRKHSYYILRNLQTAPVIGARLRRTHRVNRKAILVGIFVLIIMAVLILAFAR